MSPDRILTTHAGALPRPDDLREMLAAKGRGEAHDEQALAERTRGAVADAVRHQVAVGLDSVNDGELSKLSFTNYARERLGGWETRIGHGTAAGRAPTARDRTEFAEYFTQTRPDADPNAQQTLYVAHEPLTYVGHDAVRADIENFKAALEGVTVEEAFLPAVAPGTIEHWLQNDYYATDEEYLFAIADAMHHEYKAITDAGFLLQIDDPDLPDGWQIQMEMDVPQYRKFAELRVDALNHALRGIPEEQVRLHLCWGSYHGPHKFDIPLADVVDIILKVHAHSYSIEASNPRHEHEWRVWEDTKLPDGKVLIPGVVGHASDFIEHPELIAQRLGRYANLVGRENLMAGTDCGLGPRVGHPKIAWAKFEALAEGAQLATQQLWS